MPCYYPLDGWRSKTPSSKTGKYPIVFKRSEAQQDQPMSVPCGNCIGCRLERSRQWAMRCMYEASLHDDTAFITLTYDDEHLPEGASLNLADWQKFMKRYRKKIAPQKIRFFACGEYGTNQDITSLDTIGRPHFHAIIFGHDFEDKELLATNQNGEHIYESENLRKIWGKGHVTIGACTIDSAGYVARYCTKKILGDEAETHYQRINPITGEITNLRPEFSMQSSNPGIAKKWFDEYRNDMDKGFLTVKGVKMPPPKYFKNLYERDHEEDYMFLKLKWSENFDPDNPDYKTDRLRVREKIKIKQIKTLKREIS